jgi:hypothetical protein
MTPLCRTEGIGAKLWKEAKPLKASATAQNKNPAEARARVMV